MDQGFILSTKVQYRCGCVRKFINAIDNDEWSFWQRHGARFQRKQFRTVLGKAKEQLSAICDEGDPLQILDFDALGKKDQES